MDKLVKTPTVTFRYPLSSIIEFKDGSFSYARLSDTLKDITDFFRKEEILRSDHALLQRLIYKYNSQLRHFKSFRNLKRINQYLNKLQPFLQQYREESEHLRECCSQEQNAVFLPSRQMVQYLLAKSMQLSFTLRKVVLFCVLTFESSLSSLHRAELTCAHLIFTSLSSRVWIVGRAVILRLVEWYHQLSRWLPHLRGSEADCLNGFLLADRLQEWLDKKCPVNDDPRLVEERPTEADSTLERFMAGEEVGTEAGEETEGSLSESTESENEAAMALTRQTRSRTRDESQEEVSRPGTSREDLGQPVKRKGLDDQCRNSPKRDSKNGNENGAGLSKKRKVKNGKEQDSTNGATRHTDPPHSSGNGVFAVPKKMKKQKKRLSKTDFKKAMKGKLKKPSRFLDELSHSSMEICGEVVVLPRTSRQKLVQELTVILRQFTSKKNQIGKQPDGQKSQVLKQVKKLRVAFKRHARDALWTLVQNR